MITKRFAIIKPYLYNSRIENNAFLQLQEVQISDYKVNSGYGLGHGLSGRRNALQQGISEFPCASVSKRV